MSGISGVPKVCLSFFVDFLAAKWFVYLFGLQKMAFCLQGTAGWSIKTYSSCFYGMSVKHHKETKALPKDLVTSVCNAFLRRHYVAFQHRNKRMGP